MKRLALLIHAYHPSSGSLHKIEPFTSWPVHNYWDSHCHKYSNYWAWKCCTPILEFSNSLNLSWAFHLYVGCLNNGLLVLLFVIATVATSLLLLVGPAASNIACTATFMASVAASMVAWAIACIIHFFFQHSLCWDCLVWVCLIGTAFYLSALDETALSLPSWDWPFSSDTK